MDKLKKILQQKEDEHIEYKKASKQYGQKDAIRYCVALANENGGKLVLGVDDSRKVVGSEAFSNIGEIKSKILNKINIRVDIDEIFDDSKRVLVFNVPSRPINHLKRWTNKSELLHVINTVV